MKPHDILIALKIQSIHDRHKSDDSSSSWTQRQLAEETGVALSQVNGACHQLERCGILSPGKQIVSAALLEFLAYGVKYIFPVSMGDVTRGLPTGYAAEPLRNEFPASKDELVPVWPDAHGTVRGMSCEPICKSVPMAARKDQRLYEYLALIDAVRGGRARERSRAIEILTQRLGR